ITGAKALMGSYVVGGLRRGLRTCDPRQDCTAVRCRPRHHLGAERAARAAAIFDNHIVSEYRSQFRSNDTRELIDGTAGSEWNNDLYSIRNARGRICRYRKQQSCEQYPKPVHRTNSKIKSANSRRAAFLT